MACFKRCYPTRKAARSAIKELNNKPGFKLTNSYWCIECKAYHITSMNKKKSRAKSRKNPR